MKPLKVNSIRDVLLVGLLLLCFVASGCGQGAEQTGNEEAGEDIVVTDGLGREITLSQPAERILTSYGIATHMVFALGAQDKIVGYDSPSRNNAFFNKLMPELSNIPTPGSPAEFNLEEAMALDPDLILVPGRNMELVENLEEKGLTVFGVVAEDLEQLKDSMLNLGKALGREETAQEFVNYYENTLQKVKERTENIAEEDRPVVYLVGPMGLLSTCSSEMYQHHLIRLAGGENAGGELTGGWVEVSPEHLIEWNPDLIFVVQYTADTSPESIMEDERLQGIKAVMNKQVFWFPSTLNPWDYPSPQAVLGLYWAASKIQPDLFNDLDMQAEADQFFQKFYGKTYTELGGTLD